MFKNRTLQMKMVKNDDETEIYEFDEEEFEKKASIIGRHFKDALLATGGLVIAYVFADTIRQVAINKTEK